MDYYPDGDITQPGIIYELREFYANNNGAYKRIPSIQDIGYDALTTGPCVGSAFVKTASGTAKWYAGSTTKIYQADGSGGWTDRSGGLSYSALTWDLCSFGDNIIAANGQTGLLVATSGSFATIAGSPTGAEIVFPHANALVALNTTADGAAWHRSQTGSHTAWTVTASNDADAGTLYGGIGGPITAGGAWENLAIAWKSRAMYAGIYVGNVDPNQPVIRWQMISSDVGCVSQWAWVATEVGIIFVSERDIMLFNGNKPVSIADKIRKRFVANGNAKREKTFLTLDEANNQVYIWRSTVDGSWCDEAYTYNYKTGQWGHSAALSDPTELIIGEPKVPVRNANYQDYIAVGGGAANSAQIANLVFDETGEYPLNISGTTWLGANGFIQTGLIGRPDRDTRLTRVHLVSDSFAALSSAGFTASIILFDSNLSDSTKSVSISSLTNGAYFDVQKTARWFEIQITANDSASVNSIQRLMLELEDAESGKKWTQPY